MADDLKAELLDDPLVPPRGYSTMSNQEATDDLNTKYRTRNRSLMTASQVFNSIDKAEFDALSATDQAIIWNVLHLGEINPFGLEAMIFTAVFPNGGVTLTALAAARVEPISRAVELEIRLVPVRRGHVENARA